MPAYVIVDIEVHDPERYAEYIAKAPASVEAAGGRYLVRAGETEVLEGDWSPKRLVILEFPTVEAAKAWWSSEEYADVKAIRHATATSSMIVAVGV
jgi:uncharacterized protein (DUF1330 family)